MALNPNDTNQAAADKKQAANEALVLRQNRLEPPFPYTILPFPLEDFGIDEIADVTA